MGTDFSIKPVGGSVAPPLAEPAPVGAAVAEIVYRVVDNRTSLVARQFPEEAKLRARAYLRAQDMARQDKLRKNTDRKA